MGFWGSLRKRWVIDQGNYIKEVALAKAHIVKYYVAPLVQIVIQKKTVVTDAEKDHISVLDYINAIEKAIVQNSEINITEEERKDKERQEMRKTLKEMRIDGDSAKYLEHMEELMKKYRTNLVEDKISRIAAGLSTENKRREILKIKEEVNLETDRDTEIIGSVYSKIYNFGMDDDHKQLYKIKETKMNRVNKDDTPFNRKVNSFTGEVTGGFDKMIVELLAIVRAQEAKLGGNTTIFYVKRKSDGERELKRPRLNINSAEIKVVKTPCPFCRDTLNFERGSKTHEFESCLFNPANTASYVGDAEKEARIKRAVEFKAKGRQLQSNNRGRGQNGRGGRGGRGPVEGIGRRQGTAKATFDFPKILFRQQTPKCARNVKTGHQSRKLHAR